MWTEKHRSTGCLAPGVWGQVTRRGAAGEATSWWNAWPASWAGTSALRVRLLLAAVALAGCGEPSDSPTTIISPFADGSLDGPPPDDAATDRSEDSAGPGSDVATGADARLDADRPADAEAAPDRSLDADPDSEPPADADPDSEPPADADPESEPPADADPDSEPPVDAEPDADPSYPDVARDADPLPDALPPDAEVDASPDLAVDAAPDLAVDAAPDLAVDAEPDAVVWVLDATPDAEEDLAVDATRDAEEDLAVDGPPDASEDAAGPVCGDGVIEGPEACDPEAELPETCASLGFAFGELACEGSALVTHGCGRGISDAGGLLCFDERRVAECPVDGFPGQDAEHLTLAMDLRDEGDGTVRDGVTGLLWQLGRSERTEAQGSARSACSRLVLGGHDDWRLPTLDELVGLMDYGRSSLPAPFEGSGSWYWSVARGMGMYARHGTTALVLEGQLYTRCVRGPALGRHVYLAPGDGTVTDETTGRMWQQADDGVERTWSEALSFCAELDLGGHEDWRLPDVKELHSLLDQRVEPCIDAAAFPDTAAEGYWTSTSAARDLDGVRPTALEQAYVVHFVGCAVGWKTRRASFERTRCVRQPR